MFRIEFNIKVNKITLQNEYVLLQPLHFFLDGLFLFVALFCCLSFSLLPLYFVIAALFCCHRFSVLMLLYFFVAALVFCCLFFLAALFCCRRFIFLLLLNRPNIMRWRNYQTTVSFLLTSGGIAVNWLA